jgi:hypothetical protein
MRLTLACLLVLALIAAAGDKPTDNRTANPGANHSPTSYHRPSSRDDAAGRR